MRCYGHATTVSSDLHEDSLDHIVISMDKAMLLTDQFCMGD